MTTKQQIDRLRQRMNNLPPAEPVRPWITEPAPAPLPTPARPEPPPGFAWDEVWPDEAERQEASGEEPQA